MSFIMSLKGITGDTPILCKKGNQLCYLNIEQIGIDTKWSNDECKPNDDIQVYTGSTFTPITKIVRYKTWKEIYRILTDAGCIEVTKDHPLLTIDNKPLPAKKCEFNHQLLFADQPRVENKIHISGAYVYGLYYYANKFKKQHWYIDHPDINVILAAWISISEKYSHIAFHIIKNPDNNQYRLEPLCPNDSTKIWAEWDVNDLLQADSQSKCQFLGGLIGNKEFLNGGLYQRNTFTVASKKLAAIICHLNFCFYINYKGDNIIIVTNDDDDYPYHIGCINEIKELQSSLLTVYNIECDGGCYQAGIGRCIV